MKKNSDIELKPVLKIYLEKYGENIDYLLDSDFSNNFSKSRENILQLK